MENNKKWYHRIPGFRSGTKWKMVTASIFYFFLIVGILGNIGGDSGSEVAEEDTTAEEEVAAANDEMDAEAEEKEAEIEEREQALEEKEEQLAEQQAAAEEAANEAEAEEPAPEEDSSESSESEEPSSGEVGIGETIDVGDVSYQINERSTSNTVGDEFLNETASGVFLLLDVAVTNNGSEAITVSESNIKLSMDGNTYEPDSGASIYANGDGIGLFLEQTNPGSTTEGIVVYDVSEEVAESDSLQAEVQEGFWGTNTGLINLN